MGDDPTTGPPEKPASPFRRPTRKKALHRVVPVAETLPDYRGPTLRRDLLAGLTVAALALPSALAYAELAGLSPVVGLYALLLPTVAYTLLGSSRQLIIGPEGSIAALVATALAPIAAGDPQRYASLAALLALIVGGIFLVARVARLGWVADYFSRSVLIGYIHGVAVVLILGQLGKILGLDIEAQNPFAQLIEVAGELTELSATTLIVAVVCLGTLALLRRYTPKLPAPLIVVVVAIATSWGLSFADHGISVVGEIPSGLPGIEIPSFSLGDAIDLLPAALGIFIVSFADEILTARSFAGKHGQHVRADQELVAMGAANLAASLTHSFPVGASGSRTAVNDQMGGRTQISGLIGAGAIAIVLLILTRPMQYLPKATLGAVIIAAAIGLIDVHAWRVLARTSRVEVAIAGVTMAGVVTVGVLQALVVAVALSIVDTVRRSAAPHDAVLGWVDRLGRYGDVRLHPRAKVVPGVIVYRLDDRLFFANASYVKARIKEAIGGSATSVHWLVFDAEGLSHVDATGADALKDINDSLQKEGITFVFARLKGPMEEHLRDAGVLERIGEDHVYPTVRSAVDAALPRQG